MKSTGDREFLPSARKIVVYAVLLGFLTLFFLAVAGFLAFSIVHAWLPDAPKGRWAGPFSFLAGSLLLAAWSCRSGLQLFRSRKTPVLVLDSAGIHAPRDARSVRWSTVGKVAIVNDEGAALLQITPGSLATDPWWRRLSGSTDFDITLAVVRDADIIDAIRSHPCYRGA